MTTTLPSGRIGLTVDLHVNFLAPADGESIIAKAEAVPGGKTIGVARVDVVTVRNGEDRLCALCTVTLRAVDLPAK